MGGVKNYGPTFEFLDWINKYIYIYIYIWGAGYYNTYKCKKLKGQT